MTFEDILIEYRQRRDLRSWEEVATSLGMTRDALNKIRGGRGGLKEATVARLMEGTGLEAPQIEAAWKAKHAQDPRVRASWERWQRGATGLLALWMTMQAVIGSALPHRAEGRTEHKMYIMSSRIRAWLGSRRRWRTAEECE